MFNVVLFVISEWLLQFISNDVLKNSVSPAEQALHHIFSKSVKSSIGTTEYTVLSIHVLMRLLPLHDFHRHLKQK